MLDEKTIDPLSEEEKCRSDRDDDDGERMRQRTTLESPAEAIESDDARDRGCGFPSLRSGTEALRTKRMEWNR